MDFTFAICASPKNESNLYKIIDSIEKLYIPSYEVLVCGDVNLKHDRVKVIESGHVENANKPNGRLLAKKKNILSKLAKYENIVFLHDYIYFDKNWYSEYLSFGSEFSICMNQIINLDGTRYRDWSLWECPLVPNHNCMQKLIPYDIRHLSKVMYISGAYWIAKKQVMEEFPIREDLDYEDVEWSIRCRNKYNFSINSSAKVHLMKYADPVWHQVSIDVLHLLKTYTPPLEPRTQTHDNLDVIPW